VIALLSQFGLTDEQIRKGFADSQIVKTRYEQLDAGDLHITMLMAKGQNPIACARCYDYAAKVNLPNKALLIIVDDLGDNIGNSESTCWLYDCDYSALADSSINQIVFAGPRCKDQYLRALLAGVDAQKVSYYVSHEEAAKALNTEISKHIMVLFELYRAPDAAAVKRILTERGERGM
jgi:UDP-N-acetylmuramyl tripeptide synthase